ncbi:MAG: response regulator [Clostridiales bacterium]|jgi:two-component system response regulator (stage 0 sporulation protein A)|nr:response regulator [Clostridiales bacterium]
MDTLNLILADDKKYIEELEHIFEGQESYNILCKSHDYQKILNFIAEHKADIALLDVNLPDNGAFRILEHIRTSGISDLLVIVTGKGHNMAARTALQNGADYFIIKPFDANTLPNQIYEIYRFKYSSKHPPSEKTDKKESEASSFIAETLDFIRISPNLKGYDYLITGIDAVISDETYCKRITKALYPFIAKKWRTTAGSVERAIRNAISTTWKNGHSENYFHLLKLGDSGRILPKPTNGQFISAIARLYREQD